MAFPNYPSGQTSSGTLLQRGNGACPETFSTVARVGNIGGLDTSRASHKTSSHSTIPAGGGVAYHSYVPGMVEPGKLTFDLFIKTDSFQDRQLLSAFQLGSIINWRLVEPDQLTSITSFTGFLDSFKEVSAVDGVTTIQASIKCTGPVYYWQN